MDRLNGKLERRISDAALIVMLGVQASTPKHPSFLQKEELDAFVDLYRGNAEDVSHEI